MKPARFAYGRPATLEEAVDMLAASDGEGRVLAGGQSLVPLMNLRMSRPGALIDLASVSDLTSVDEADGSWRVGAMVTQDELSRHAAAMEACPLLRAAIPWIGHLQIRTRGTVGGSIAHADPAAELPAVAITLDAVVNVQGTSGPRSIPAAEFFVGPYTTSLQPDEILTSVDFPAHPEHKPAFSEFVRRKGDFAITGLALTRDSGSQFRATAFGVAGTPVRLAAAEEVLAGGDPSPALAAAAGEAAAAEADPWDDAHASEGFRRQLVGTLVRRAVEEVAA